MPKQKVWGYHIQRQVVCYTVDADSPEEAREMIRKYNEFPTMELHAKINTQEVDGPEIESVELWEN